MSIPVELEVRCKKMEMFSTFFGLKLSLLIFGPSETVSESVHAVNTAQYAYTAVQPAVHRYKTLRSNTRFTAFLNCVCDEPRSLEVIEEPCSPRRRRIPQRLDNLAEGHFPGTVEYYYRQQYFEVLDLIVQDINNRFNCPSYNILKDLEDLRMSTIKDALQCRDPVAAAMVSEVRTLVKMYLTVPVTTATSERSCSTLRRLKTYLRSTMKKDRLNNVLLTYAHNERTDQLDFTKIAEEFTQRNERRAKYLSINLQRWLLRK